MTVLDPMLYHIEQAPPGVGDRWRKWAACKGQARLMDGATAEDECAALAVCGRCPVQDQCRGEVLDLDGNQDPGGVCGGLTEQQRKKRRRRARWDAKQDPVPEGHKRCSQCRELRTTEEYYTDSAAGDGLWAKCVYCCRADARARRAARKKRERS